jgi:hypothetical protein
LICTSLLADHADCRPFPLCVRSGVAAFKSVVEDGLGLQLVQEAQTADLPSTRQALPGFLLNEMAAADQAEQVFRLRT